MTFVAYTFTVGTVLIGALWIGIGGEMGKDLYRIVWRSRFRNFLKNYKVGHVFVKKKAARLVTKVLDKPLMR